MTDHRTGATLGATAVPLVALGVAAVVLVLRELATSCPAASRAAG